MLSHLCVDDNVIDDDVALVTAVVTTSVSHLELDKTFLQEIIKGYVDDPFCKKLTALVGSSPGLTEKNGLLFVTGCLVIPHINPLH